jgi:hypothetical protein
MTAVAKPTGGGGKVPVYNSGFPRADLVLTSALYDVPPLPLRPFAPFVNVCVADRQYATERPRSIIGSSAA